MLTSGSTTTTSTTRTLLYVGITFELLAILFAITLTQSRMYMSAWVRGVPIVLVSMGIVGLAVALMVEMFKVSVGMAAVMCGLLVVGVGFCIFALFFGVY